MRILVPSLCLCLFLGCASAPAPVPAPEAPPRVAVEPAPVEAPRAASPASALPLELSRRLQARDEVARVYLRIGRELLAEGRYHDARDCFRQARAAAPGDPAAEEELARVEWLLGERPGEIRYLGEAYRDEVQMREELARLRR